MSPSLRPDTSLRTPQPGESLSPPSGLAFTPEGKIVVSDDFNHRIQIYNPEGTLELQFGEKGKEPGQLMYPKGVTVDSGGNIFVADSWNHRVQKFDSEGQFKKSFGTYGEGRGQLNEPYDVLIDDHQRLIVIERYNHRIQFFDPEGPSLGWIGSRATVFEQQLADLYETAYNLQPRPAFEFPTSIARDSTGCFFITDSGNHRILKFDEEWRLVFSLGERGQGPGQFNYPTCLTVSSSDLVHVADLNNDRIQSFTTEGVFVAELNQLEEGLPCKMPGILRVDSHNRIWACLTFDPKLYRLAETESSLETLYGRVVENHPAPAALFGRGQRREKSGDRAAARQDYLEALNLQGDASVTDTDWNLLAALPEHLTRLLESTDDPTDLAMMNLFESRLTSRREELLQLESRWSSVIENLLAKDVARENRVLANQEDAIAFDQELQDFKKQDKALFIENRQLLHSYRRTALEMGRWLNLRFSTRPDATFPEQLVDRICALLSDALNTVQEILKKKESSEETLVQALQNTETDPEGWKNFRVGAMVNSKRMELVRQFLVEWSTGLGALHSALLAYPDNDLLKEKLIRLFCRQPEALRFPPVLLAVQEDIALPYHLENLWFLVMDGLPTESHGPVPQGPDPVWEPYTFDTEPMLPEGVFRNFSVLGHPIRIQNDEVHIGHERYLLSQIKEEAQARLDGVKAILDCQQDYNSRLEELFQTLWQLLTKRTQLEIQINRLDVRDKITPIQIGRQALIQTYQVGLVYRMIHTLMVNELQNLVRLTVASSLSMATESGGKPGPFLQTVQELSQSLQQAIGQHSRDLKKAELDLLALGSPEEGQGNGSDAGEIQSRLAETQFHHFREQIQLKRTSGLYSGFNRLQSFLEGEEARDGESPLKFEFCIGGAGWQDGKFLAPFGVAHTKNGDLWVSDNQKHSVLRFSPGGDFIQTGGQFGNGPGCMSGPFGIATGIDGVLHVADHHNRRILRFSNEGRYLGSLGGNPENSEAVCPGLLFDVATDHQGSAWIADSGHNRILIYKNPENPPEILNGNGNLAAPFSVVPLEDGSLFVSDKSPQPIKRLDRRGQIMATLDPKVTVDNEGLFLFHDSRYGLFVADTFGMRLVLLDDNLKEIWQVFNPGRRAGQFLRIAGISVHENRLALVDMDNHRVQVMTLPAP